MSTITSTQSVTPTAPKSVAQLLDNLRRRIRWYVLAEGIAMLIVWLVVAFWIGLALDYLPVLVGANEMPRSARKVVLVVAAIGACCVLYYYTLRRVFSSFRDSSLALLVERQFPAFRDSLITTVEANQPVLSPRDRADREAIERATTSDPADSLLGTEMLAQTVQRAQAGVADVALSKVFSYRPVATKLLAAAVALGSLMLLGVFGRDALGIGASRLLLLSNDPWPRRARIELVGFDDGEKKVAKGTDLIVRVRADARRQFPPPELCSILYETSDGNRGRVNMSRDGEPRDGFQYYVFNGKPFKSILDDIRFDVIGYDHRLRDQRVSVVLSPVVSSVRLRSELPAYTGLLPRDEVWAPGIQLPIGSKVTARIQSSKDLVSAKIHDIDSGEENIFDLRSSEPLREIIHHVESLSGRVAVAVSFVDTDGIESLEPFLLTIGAIEDEIPKVEVSLRGISNAITSNARLVVEGSVTDDYEVASSWFDLKIDGTSRRFNFPLASEETDIALDLREESAAAKKAPLVLKPQDRIVFSVKASDKFNLEGESHTGSSDPTVLTVVRPDELLAILDGRELGLRRRFEQIRTEMIQSRDSLARLRASFTEDTNRGNADPEAAKQNLVDLRDRWASWADQKASQTVLEVDGIALAFEDIREELINNRVDTPERKSRMEEQIIAPLRTIADDLFPAFRESISELRTALAVADATAKPSSIVVLENADKIIVSMDAVLDKMLELEDYAELVNIVRQIIQQQDNLLEKTKDEQKARVLDLVQ